MNIPLSLSVALTWALAAQAHAAAFPVQILHFGFDEATGNTVIDALGKGNDAMLIDDATRSKDVPPVTGLNRTSLLLNGKAHVTAPRVDLKNRSFSLTAWVKTTDMMHNQALLSQGDSLRNGKNLVLRVTPVGSVQFSFTGDTTSTPEAVIGLDSWHHTAFTFDKTTRQRRVYVDGVLQASGTASGVYLGSGITDIGRLNTYPFGSEYWKGSMDNISVYDEVLSPDDIRLLAVRDMTATSSSSRKRSVSSRSSSVSSSSSLSHLIGRLERLTLRRALGRHIPAVASSSSSSSSRSSSSMPRASSVARTPSAPIDSAQDKPVASTSSRSSTPTLPSTSHWYIVTSYQLRVRLDSRATSKALLTLIKGDQIEVFSFLKNGWAKVRTLDGTEGFVHAGFIEQVQ